MEFFQNCDLACCCSSRDVLSCSGYFIVLILGERAIGNKHATKERWESLSFVPRLPGSIERLDLLLMTLNHCYERRSHGAGKFIDCRCITTPDKLVPRSKNSVEANANGVQLKARSTRFWISC